MKLTKGKYKHKMWAMCKQHCLGQEDTELDKLRTSHQRSMLDPTEEWVMRPELSSFIFGSDSQSTLWVLFCVLTNNNKITESTYLSCKVNILWLFHLNFEIFLCNFKWLTSWYCVVFFRKRCIILELRTLRKSSQLTLDQVQRWISQG